MRVGACAFLVILGLLGSSSAVAATTSWEFKTSAEFPGQVLYFGETLAGGGPTEPHEYVLANTGETPITVKNLIIGVETPSDPHVWSVYRQNCIMGRPLEPGETCSVGVVFDPLTAGWREGSLRAQAVKGGPPPAQVAFEGHAIGPWVEPEPESLDFGSVQVGAGPSPVQTITLVNEEPLPLMIYGTSVTDTYERPEFPAGPFRVVGGTCHEGVVVPTSASCTVEVILEPSHVGSFESKVVIADNAESRQSVRLRGVGVAPPPPPGIGTITKPEPDNASPSAPVAPATSTPTKPELEPPLRCPKGKRKAARQGKTVCVRHHKHHRRHGHIGRT